MSSASDIFKSFSSHASNSAEYHTTGKADVNHAAGVVGGTNSPSYTGSALSQVLNFNYKGESSGSSLLEHYSDPAGDGFKDSPGYDWWSEYANSAGASVPSSPQILEYIDAPYAQHYGMDVSTAYNEALANTAYQRKVKDLLAAGLNPVLGISGSGADNFYGTPLQVLSDGSSYGGGTSYGSSGSGKTTSNLADRAIAQLKYNLPTLVGGFVGLATKNPAKAYYASQAASGVANIIKYF